MARSAASALVLLATLLACSSSAHSRDFLVGGTASVWHAPPSSEALNRWAESNRFQVGDTLVWDLKGHNDSVLRVSRVDYLRCNTTSPLTRGDGVSAGRFVVDLERSGAYYFINGEESMCHNGGKVIVVVMAERRKFAEAPASLPSDGQAPASAPTAGEAADLKAGLLGAMLLALGAISLVF